MAIRQHIERGWCIVAHFNGNCIGYVFGWWRLRYAPWCRPITQLLVRQDVRRCGVAEMLVAEYARLAQRAGQVALQAWTRVDLLAAHALWKSLRWTAIAVRAPVKIALYRDTETTTARKKPAVLYRFSLTAIPHPDFYDRPTRGGCTCGTIVTTAIPNGTPLTRRPTRPPPLTRRRPPPTEPTPQTVASTDPLAVRPAL